MENVTLNMLYEELKKIEKTVQRVDQKIENFIGFEAISKKEVENLNRISARSKKNYKPLDKLAQELEVKLHE
ncbi:hypothetical protein HY988_06360 [Candidatus Micrarchaeota archaeon]|nr:hypothetical protein [Candidatus Micrarchaeota archaeon]